ncbi:DsbA family protein [Streptomyces sp. NPDC003077]|uniref:DsbA family protein n=1 Tax=Streptomyces sp. NPDC003077 TaxID=3154443 RepID=UPI0033B41EAE
MEPVPVEPVRLTYAFDAYCGWCYGFGPAVHDFARRHADRIELRVLSGGLFTGPQAVPVSAFPYISEANARIAQLTGATFGAAYEKTLARGSAVMDSADAAAGLIALRRQAPERMLDAVDAMQRAWYQDGRSLSDVQVHRDIAEHLGLDADAVAADYAAPDSRGQAEREFREVRSLGVRGYPTLLLHTPAGPARLGGPLSSADELTQALEQYLAAEGGRPDRLGSA